MDKRQNFLSILNFSLSALPNLSNILELEYAHICLLFFRTFFELDVLSAMNLLLQMSCWFLIVLKFSVGTQKVSERDWIRTHAREP